MEMGFVCKANPFASSHESKHRKSKALNFPHGDDVSGLVWLYRGWNRTWMGFPPTRYRQSAVPQLKFKLKIQTTLDCVDGAPLHSGIDTQPTRDSLPVDPRQHVSTARGAKRSRLTLTGTFFHSSLLILSRAGRKKKQESQRQRRRRDVIYTFETIQYRDGWWWRYGSWEVHCYSAYSSGTDNQTYRLQ